MTWRDTLSNKALFHDEMNKNFNKAKYISDYLGMIVRFSFVIIATRFFYREWEVDKGTLKAHMDFVCFGCGAILASILSFRIFMILLWYLLGDVAKQKSFIMKAVTATAAIWIYYCLIQGVWDMTTAVASASSVLTKSR